MNSAERQRSIRAIMLRLGCDYGEACSYMARRGWERRRARMAAAARKSDKNARTSNEDVAEAVRRWRAACGDFDD